MPRTAAWRGDDAPLPGRTRSLLEAEEKAPGQLQPTREAWKIAARLKPAPGDLRLTPVSAGEAIAKVRESPRPVPSRGYVGRYPLHEREDVDEPS